MDDDSEKKVGNITGENAPADLDKAFEADDDPVETPVTPDTPAPIAPTEEPGSDVSPLATPDAPAAPKPFQDVAPTPSADNAKPQDIKVEVSNSFTDPKDSKGKSGSQASNVPVFPNADMGAGTVNVFPKKTSAVPAVLATVFAILFVLALAALAWALYANNWNYQPKSTTKSTSQTSTADTAKSLPASTTPSVPVNTLQIGKLGVQLTKLPDSIADADDVITTTNGVTSAWLTTPEIQSAIQLDDNAKNSTCNFGVLSAQKGTYNNQPIASGQFVKQFDGFWLEYASPQSECTSSTTSNANQLVSQAAQAFQTYLKNTSNITAL